MAKTTDYSGYRCKAGEVLDFKNQNITLTAPIRAAKGCVIKRAKFLAPTLKQHQAAVEIPHGADDVTVDRCSFSGGSYNGLVVALGERPRIIGNEVLPGSGWFCKLLEADGALVQGNRTKDLRRGGLYIGDDDRDDDNYTDDVRVVGNIFDGADEEAVFRSNNGRFLVLQDNLFINTRSKSKKECAQFRGGTFSSFNNHYIGSIATGQTPVGRRINAEGVFEDDLLYGYFLAQAGSVIIWRGGSVSLAKSFDLVGTKYTLANGGGGYAFTAKKKANGLPDAKLVASGVKIVGAKYATGGLAKVVK